MKTVRVDRAGGDTIASPAEQSALPELSDDPAAAQLAPALNPRYLFYCFTCGQKHASASDAAAGSLSAEYSWTIWRPRLLPALPPGLPNQRSRLRLLFRWAVHRLHLFAGSGSGALLIYEGQRVVHYSGFTRRYWRFPFVANDDFQIGATWTDPACRGKGLASLALQMVVATLAKPGRRLWYVVEDVNEPSIRVVEKARFTLTAEGTWVRPWGSIG